MIQKGRQQQQQQQQGVGGGSRAFHERGMCVLVAAREGKDAVLVETINTHHSNKDEVGDILSFSDGVKFVSFFFYYVFLYICILICRGYYCA